MPFPVSDHDKDVARDVVVAILPKTVSPSDSEIARMANAAARAFQVVAKAVAESTWEKG
jgi:hypothetical protein